MVIHCYIGDLMYSTVRLDSSIKQELDSLKSFKRESYADVIQRLIFDAKEDFKLSSNEIKQIEASLADIKAGRVSSWKKAEKKWGF